MRTLLIITVLLISGIGLNAQDFEVEGDAKITVMERTISADDNVVRLANGTLARRKYDVGDFIQGGIVFWVDESGEHGLVVSKEDLKSTPDDSSHQWSTSLTEVTGATGGTLADGSANGKGAGAMNTMLIISKDRADTDSAARLCGDLIEGGYGDWYLPSKGELYLIYINRFLVSFSAVLNDGNPLGGGYWSSLESGAANAWWQDFLDGNQYHTQKNNVNIGVRAIRAF